MSLFRPEALARQERRALGTVRLYQPVRHWVFTGALVALVVVAVVAAALTEYPQKETVAGRLVPGAGLAEVVTSDSGGTLTTLRVSVGSHVDAGDVIGTLSAERFNKVGSVSQEQRRQTLSRINELTAQESDQRGRVQAEDARLRGKIADGGQNISRLESAVAIELKQLELSKKQLANSEPLVKQGYMSVIERDRREQVVLEHERAMLDLRSQLASQKSDVRDLTLQLTQSSFAASTERSQLRSSAAALNQALVETDAQSSIVLRAPIAGRIAAINARPGEYLPVGSSLATVAPPGPYLAELVVPTRAAGRISVGNPVRLMVDAFPFQRFGVLKGAIREIARAPMPASADQVAKPGDIDRRYRVLVALDKVPLAAFERRGELRAGMSVKADIVFDRRTLLDIAFDPIRAVKERSS